MASQKRREAPSEKRTILLIAGLILVSVVTWRSYFGNEPNITPPFSSAFIDSLRTQRVGKSKPRGPKPKVKLELNNADAEALKKIRGIGAYTAASIVKYRNLLGGYVSLKQLLEVRGMKRKYYEQIIPRLRIDPLRIRKIDINKTSARQLARHPYISYEKAKDILSLRRELQTIDSLDVLVREFVLTTQEAKKLSPYLVFGQQK